MASASGTVTNNGLDHSGTVQLWDLRDPAHPTTEGPALVNANGVVTAVAFSLDGHTLADGTSTNSLDASEVQLWDLRDPTHPTTIGPALVDPASAVNAVAFSPDGQTVASGGSDGAVRTWNLADPFHPIVTGATGPPLASDTGIVRSVAFSPDGHILASAFASASDNGAGAVQLWDLREPTHPKIISDLSGDDRVGPTNAVAFSPDGQTLASGSSDGAVRMWDLVDPTHPLAIGPPLTGHTDVVYSVAFSPNGNILASGSSDGTIRLWNQTPNSAIRWICATTRNALAKENWSNYIPQLPYHPPCA